MKQHFAIAIFTVILSACETSEVVETPDARLVVEGILHAGQPPSVEITKEILFKREEDDTTTYLSGLDVYLDDGVEVRKLDDNGNGTYTDNKLVSTDKTYKISTMYEGQEIYAKTGVPSLPLGFEASDNRIKVEPLTGGGRPTANNTENLELTWTYEDQAYYIVIASNLETDPDPINTSGFQRPVFRSEPIQDDSYEIRGFDFEYYGDYAIILFKVNADYAALYEDPGDNSLTIKSPYSNITNGLGVFTAVNSDTLYVEVHD